MHAIYAQSCLWWSHIMAAPWPPLCIQSLIYYSLHMLQSICPGDVWIRVSVSWVLSVGFLPNQIA